MQFSIQHQESCIIHGSPPNPFFCGKPTHSATTQASKFDSLPLRQELTKQAFRLESARNTFTEDTTRSAKMWTQSRSLSLRLCRFVLRRSSSIHNTTERAPNIAAILDTILHKVRREPRHTRKTTRTLSQTHPSHLATSQTANPRIPTLAVRSHLRRFQVTAKTNIMDKSDKARYVQSRHNQRAQRCGFDAAAHS
jgi:hypothetical protein